MNDRFRDHMSSDLNISGATIDRKQTDTDWRRTNIYSKYFFNDFLISES